MSTESRRFTLLDVMVLVAATAPGLAVVRDSVPSLLDGSGSRSSGLIPWEGLVSSCMLVLGAAPLVAFWSLALLVLRLLRPRPTVRRLARQPGFVANGVAVLGIAPGVIMAVPFLLDDGHFGEWGLLASFPVGYAVAASWLTLTLNRRWRPAPDLFDRAGRILGVFWIATVPALLIVLFSIV